eukprot:3356389-Amphidinium_carterae.1
MASVNLAACPSRIRDASTSPRCFSSVSSASTHDCAALFHGLAHAHTSIASSRENSLSQTSGRRLACKVGLHLLVATIAVQSNSRIILQ